jgi:hypothetical protein
VFSELLNTALLGNASAQSRMKSSIASASASCALDSAQRAEKRLSFSCCSLVCIMMILRRLFVVMYLIEG